MSDKIEYQNVTATLPVEMVKYLDALGTRRDLSRSQVLRIMVRAYQAQEQAKDEARAKEVKESK